MTIETARELDKKDPLNKYRSYFSFPKNELGKDYLYFCGNSLGLQTNQSYQAVNNELEKWRKHGVEGHFTEPNPWISYHKNLENTTAKLVGAKNTEVVSMNALTVNLHLLLLSFYNPTAKKYKIIIEKNAFPSDNYAVQSQIDFYFKKGLLTQDQKENAIIYLEPDEWGIYETETILKTLQETEVAILLLSGVNYQTGQVFELETISKACKEKNICIGLDLAHAIGNVPLKLHDWQIDFAVWCTYKYLNGGPGSVGGAYVHEKYCTDHSLPRLHGWWSNKEENRFQMSADIDPYQTAEAWQLSNAPILSMASLMGSMEVFNEVSLELYFQKAKALSDYLACLIKEKLPSVNIITPLDAKGCQLSVFIPNQTKEFIILLKKDGLIADWRNHPKGGIIRLAPVPFYNSYEDCYQVVEAIHTRLK